MTGSEPDERGTEEESTQPDRDESDTPPDTDTDDADARVANKPMRLGEALPEWKATQAAVRRQEERGRNRRDDPDASPAQSTPDESGEEPPEPGPPPELPPDEAPAVVARYETEWHGRALDPYRVGDPGRAALEVVPRLAKSPIGRPDTAVDACVVGGLEVRAASIRGLSHRYDGTTRQDEYCLAASDEDEWLVVAVADGVSAGPLSHYAATMAARHGCMELTRHLESGAPESVDWTTLVGGVTELIYTEGRDRLTRRGDETVSDALVESAMASTVCYAVVATAPGSDAAFPAYLLAIGDTSAWTRAGEHGWRRIAGGKDMQDAIASNAVFALPSKLDTAPAAIEVRLAAGEPLLIVTDGVGDAVGEGATAVGRFLASVWETPPDPVSFVAQMGFARKGVDDDRTGVAIWPGIE